MLQIFRQQIVAALMNTRSDMSSNTQTRLFLCLKDNYGVLVHDPASGATAAIDAPEAAPVEAALTASGWKLSDILVTHHHGDHTAGIAELKQRHRARVVAPHREAAKIPDVDETVGEGDTVTVGTLSARSCRKAVVCRRYSVLDRLRTSDRRHSRDNVAVPPQAARASG